FLRSVVSKIREGSARCSEDLQRGWSTLNREGFAKTRGAIEGAAFDSHLELVGCGCRILPVDPGPGPFETDLGQSRIASTTETVTAGCLCRLGCRCASEDSDRSWAGGRCKRFGPEGVRPLSRGDRQL